MAGSTAACWWAMHTASLWRSGAGRHSRLWMAPPQQQVEGWLPAAPIPCASHWCSFTGCNPAKLLSSPCRNLTLLQQAGAELVFFSPLKDTLPPGISGVYLGGGYPERCVCGRRRWMCFSAVRQLLHPVYLAQLGLQRILPLPRPPTHPPPLKRTPAPRCRTCCCRYALDLADNRALRAGLRAFARAGGVVYAECGGLLFLSRSVQPQDEAAMPMGGCARVRPCCAACQQHWSANSRAWHRQQGTAAAALMPAGHQHVHSLSPGPPGSCSRCLPAPHPATCNTPP